MTKLSILLRTGMLALAAALLLVSCTDREVRAELDDIESYIEIRPDSALAAIRAIDTLRLQTRAMRAQYSLLHAMALDKNNFAYTDPEIIRPAVDYFIDRCRNPKRQLQSLLYLGRLQSNAGDYPAAIVTYGKADSLLNVVNDPHWAALLYSAMSYVYSQCYDTEEDLKYASLAYQRCIDGADYARSKEALLYLCESYSNASAWEKADSIYSILVSDPEICDTLRGQVFSSYGHMLVCKPEPDFEAALSCFVQAMALSGCLNSDNHYGAYGYAAAQLGYADASDRIFRFVQDGGDNSVLYWKSMAENANGNHEQAYRDVMSVLHKKDVSVIAALHHSASKAQRDYLSMENARQEFTIRRKNMSIIILVLSLVLVVGLVLVVSVRFRHQVFQERQELLQNMEDLCIKYKEIDGKYQRMQEESRELQKKYFQIYKSQFDDLHELGKIVLLAEKSDNNLKTSQIYEKIKRISSCLMPDKEGQEKFEDELNLRLNGVMERFRTDFPNLSDEEYRVASLMFAQFNSRMISVLCRGITYRAAQMRKLRLREKIKNSGSPNKDFFLALLEN